MSNVLICVVHKEDHSIGFYDLESRAEIGRIEVGEYPHEMVFSRTGMKAYCTMFGVPLAESPGTGGNEIAVVDIIRGAVVRRLQMRDVSRPHGIAIDEQSGSLYVTCEHPSTVLRFSLDDEGETLETAFALSGHGAHNISLR
jgi:DNA-binding beta-propeller fold protein YncE